MCKIFFHLLQKIVFYDWLPALLDLTPEEIEENKYTGKLSETLLHLGINLDPYWYLEFMFDKNSKGVARVPYAHLIFIVRFPTC